MTLGRKRSLRGRLTFGHTLIVFLAITLFAELAQNMLGYYQRDTVNARLATSATALALVAAHDGSALQTQTLRALASPEYDAAIVRAGGHVRFSTAPVPAIVASSALHPPHIAEAWKVDAGNLQQYRIGVVAVAGTPAQSAVFWHRVDYGATDSDERAALVLFVAIPCVVLIAFAVGDRVTRLALEPLTELARVAATIEASDLSDRIAPTPVDAELADMCATLNRMFGRLESAFERQRRFTADASHEFRAPLSVIMAEADLAASGLDSNDEYRESAHAVLREAKRIELITENLLTIARGETIIIGKEPVDVGAAARSAIATLRGAANERDVRLENAIDTDVWVVGNAMSIMRICIALLDNAVKFTDRGSRVLVCVSREDHVIRLVLCDEGPGFSRDGLIHAFERFWRDDATRTHTGTGLGLSIVQALVSDAQGTIAIENRSPRGCRVTVQFPALQKPLRANVETRTIA